MPPRRPDRFTVLRDELRRDIADSEARLGARIDGVERRVDATREELRGEIASTRDELRAEIASTRDGLREEIARSAEETRRHFDDGRLSRLEAKVLPADP